MNREEEMLERLSGPLSKKQESNIHKLIKMIDNDLQDIEKAISDVDNANTLKTSDKQHLDRLAELFNLYRKSGESNSKFKFRINLEGGKRINNATPDELREIIALTLDTDKSNILVEEDPNYPAQVTFVIREEDLQSTEITKDEFTSQVTNISAAGVRSEAKLEGTFTYMGEGDTNDPSKGYYDPDDGIKNGTYSGIIG